MKIRILESICIITKTVGKPSPQRSHNVFRLFSIFSTQHLWIPNQIVWRIWKSKIHFVFCWILTEIWASLFCSNVCSWNENVTMYSVLAAHEEDALVLAVGSFQLSVFHQFPTFCHLKIHSAYSSILLDIWAVWFCSNFCAGYESVFSFGRAWRRCVGLSSQ